MPERFEKIRRKIWAGLKGKINPRTKKPYTESESYAIATTQYKKKYGKAPSRSMSVVNKFIIELRKGGKKPCPGSKIRSKGKGQGKGYGKGKGPIGRK